MSTFNGYVKEFPNIRIDYFRTHLGKPPPAACFLSHVHSDHLLGLESLKMPFVYCSATTRRLLLRMEKYPHRINFAKGILESRKQHYRHLNRVLRALPLHTATELELGPKSRLRVTTIDANHCPGSVMFLIEDDYRAILYTGDVRAEPWWVNSIVQNPFILPYTCGIKRLDGMYLDTTFSTHDDAYRHFPSKAEGLKELLGKVAQFPKDTVFYFRAWTLGYEQVWMALSNLLQTSVHVDDYQMNLFAGIMEDGRHGYSMFEGPALTGFPIGNSNHPGCLTQGSASRIHSCEPGMPCHAKLVQKNVVWIIPIVSRTDDGIELLELGAGGGLGDLQQTSELEIQDETTLKALHKYCSEIQHEGVTEESIQATFQLLKRGGSLKISLEGFETEGKDDIPLRQFAETVLERGGLSNPKLKDHKPAAPSNQQRAQTIHFPFSRHSSYEELRDLVSVFRPKDICPCTVDLDTWSEELSMKSLFGDLCSTSKFFHDHQIEAEAREFQRQREVQHGLKRKRPPDSQVTEDEEESAQQEQFQTPQGSLRGSPRATNVNNRVHREVAMREESSISRRQRSDPGILRATTTSSNPNREIERRTHYIMTSFRALNGGRDLITKEDPQKSTSESVFSDANESQRSLPASGFDSNVCPGEDMVNIPQMDGAAAEVMNAGRESKRHSWATRLATRKEAHEAALKSLWDNDHGHWDDLNVSCIGRKGHSDVEVELGTCWVALLNSSMLINSGASGLEHGMDYAGGGFIQGLSSAGRLAGISPEISQLMGQNGNTQQVTSGPDVVALPRPDQ